MIKIGAQRISLQRAASQLVHGVVVERTGATVILLNEFEIFLTLKCSNLYRAQKSPMCGF